MTTSATVADPLPPAPQPQEDGYPAEAVAPRFDEQGRKFVPEAPYPGILNLPCGPADALVLSRFWAETAAEAGRTGNTEAWSFAETRSAHFLRLARNLQPLCVQSFLRLTPEQLEVFTIKHPKGAV
jgi:hypothetical protein